MSDLQKLIRKAGVVVLRNGARGWYQVEVPIVHPGSLAPLRIAAVLRRTPEAAITAMLQEVESGGQQQNPVG